MARYGIAQGGNKRNFPQWDNLYSSAREGFIHYASHLMTRHKVIPLNFDGAHGNWHSYFKQEMPSGHPVLNDEFDMLWLNAGSRINSIVIHNKVVAPAATAVTVRIEDTAGVVVLAAVTVPLTTAGWVSIPVNLLLTQNASVVVKHTAGPAGSLEQTCFTVFADLVNYYSEHECSCATTFCDVTMPNPVCFTPTVTL
jgi:hypothetical protein